MGHTTILSLMAGEAPFRGSGPEPARRGLGEEQKWPVALPAHPSPQSELAVSGGTDCGDVVAFGGREGVSCDGTDRILARPARPSLSL